MDPISLKVNLGASSELPDPVYVEDFFSIRRYEGGGFSTIDIGGVQSKFNGFSLIKCLSLTTDWALKPFPNSTFTKWIRSNTGDIGSNTGTHPNFNTNGDLYLQDTGSGTGLVSRSGEEYCSWNFGSAPGFLDVIFYTGNGTTQTINHNLGSTPGAIFVKRLDTFDADSNWAINFSSMSSISKTLDLSSSDSVASDSDCFTASNSTSFSVGNDAQVNSNSRIYVAFVFASDDARFGTNRNQSIIKCGKISSGANITVVLGFEPQFLLLKEDADNSSWELYDNIRGLTAQDVDDSVLHPDTNASQTTSENIRLNSDGFKAKPLTNPLPNDIYYIAIRRPHKPVQSATEVYSQTYLVSDATNTTNAFSSGTRSVDTVIQASRTTYSANRLVFQRPHGDGLMWTNSQSYDYTTHLNNISPPKYFDSQFGVNPRNIIVSNPGVFHFFSRAPGFYDVVSYRGEGFVGNTHTRAIPHNLEVSPELMIVKKRSSSSSWFVFTESNGANSSLILDTSVPAVSYTVPLFPAVPTANTFTVGYNLDQSSGTYVAMLFASLPGICKVGSYTASNSSDQIIDCGFTNGARFVMLKDSTSSSNIYTTYWSVNTSAQGITTGDDLTDAWNIQHAEFNANNVKPHSSGFIATQSGSSTGGSVISSGATVQFLAIA